LSPDKNETDQWEPGGTEKSKSACSRSTRIKTGNAHWTEASTTIPAARRTSVGSGRKTYFGRQRLRNGHEKENRHSGTSQRAQQLDRHLGTETAANTTEQDQDQIQREKKKEKSTSNSKCKNRFLH
jgi:hypothetical protein